MLFASRVAETISHYQGDVHTRERKTEGTAQATRCEVSPASRLCLLLLTVNRKMMKIDVNKSGRIFDFLVSSGMLILAYDPTVKPVYPPLKDPNAMFGAPLSVDLVNGQQMVNGHANGHLGSKGVNNGVKDMNGAPAVPMGMPIGVNGH
jgi:hypothetical protein